MLNKGINVFIIKFGNEIRFQEVPLFRGAVLRLLGNDTDILFHNHSSDTTFRYSYPLIQYKRIRKKMAMFCIGEGTETIGKLLALNETNITLGDRETNLEIESAVPKRYIVQVWDTAFTYNIRNWIPLNSQNYTEYKSIEELSARIELLEKILVGNILSFAKGMGIEVEKQITCKLVSVEEPRILRVKGVKVMAFNAKFKTNISLPDYIGLGKHASIGYGTVVRAYGRKNPDNETSQE